MATEFEVLKGTQLYDDLKEGHDWGFKVFRNLIDVDFTALDVADAYYLGKKKNELTKHDGPDENNRWLNAGFKKGTKKCNSIFSYMKKRYKIEQADIYANWIADGNNFGRHNDVMDVLILQVWNKMAYGVESENEHASFTLSPGDAIYIRNGTYHTPIILGERMTMSFSWR